MLRGHLGEIDKTQQIFDGKIEADRIKIHCKNLLEEIETESQSLIRLIIEKAGELGDKVRGYQDECLAAISEENSAPATFLHDMKQFNDKWRNHLNSEILINKDLEMAIDAAKTLRAKAEIETDKIKNNVFNNKSVNYYRNQIEPPLDLLGKIEISYHSEYNSLGGTKVRASVSKEPAPVQDLNNVTSSPDEMAAASVSDTVSPAPKPENKRGRKRKKDPQDAQQMEINSEFNVIPKQEQVKNRRSSTASCDSSGCILLYAESKQFDSITLGLEENLKIYFFADRQSFSDQEEPNDSFLVRKDKSKRKIRQRKLFNPC